MLRIELPILSWIEVQAKFGIRPLNYGLFSPFGMKMKNNRKWPEIFLDISIYKNSANKPNIRKR
jgi:hypothetical protein